MGLSMAGWGTNAVYGRLEINREAIISWGKRKGVQCWLKRPELRGVQILALDKGLSSSPGRGSRPSLHTYKKCDWIKWQRNRPEYAPFSGNPLSSVLRHWHQQFFQPQCLRYWSSRLCTGAIAPYRWCHWESVIEESRGMRGTVVVIGEESSRRPANNRIRITLAALRFRHEP